MTTICYREGIMAADTRAYAGDKLPIGTKTKIRKLKNGTLIGVSTVQVGLSEQILDWAEQSMDPAYFPKHDEKDGFLILMVEPDRRAFFSNSKSYFAGPLDAPFWAIGSGEHYAIGALAMGASATEAVEIAAKFDPWTAGPITTLTHI